MQPFLDAIARACGSFTCTEDDLNDWLDQSVATALKKAGVLVFKEAASGIICPECGCHPVSPEFRGTDKSGTRRYVITCNDPSIGTTDYISNLSSYSLDLPKLAKTISTGLHLTGQVSETIVGQLFLLGIKEVSQGSVRCYLLLTSDIERHKEMFEASSKSASTVIFYAHTVPISFIDTVAVIHIADVLTFSGNKIKINDAPLNQAASRLFGENSYKDGVLSVHGTSIARITSGTKLDNVLKYLSAPEHIDKPIVYSAILENYNKSKPKRKNGATKIFGAEQWCDQTMTDLRKKCGNQSMLVDSAVQRGGKKDQENTLIFRSKS